jgi:carbonic anhydrase
MLKQIPHLLGDDADYEGDFAFDQPDHENTFTQIAAAFETTNMGAVWISVFGLAVLLLWDLWLGKKHRIFKLIQGPLVVVAGGIGIHLMYQEGMMPFSLRANELVQLPESKTLSAFFDNFTFPDFSSTVLSNPDVYITALIIASIASIETLLSAEAADKLDPDKRNTPANRELLAQGAGNIVSGMIGGLPVTQVIVRSSTNVEFGAKTKTSAVLHGFWLLISAMTIASVLNLMPMAALACILMFVGFKLAKPAIFKKMFKSGWEQFIPFMATIIGILFTDLLVGIGIGMAVSLLFLLWNIFRAPLEMAGHEVAEGLNEGIYTITLSEEVSFLNKLRLTRIFDKVPDNSRLVINAARTRNMHFDVREMINDFQVNAATRNIKVELIGLNNTGTKSDDDNLVDKDQDRQSKLQPLDVLAMLKEGNYRFRTNQSLERDLMTEAHQTSFGQFPLAAVLGCIDSRTSPELIFDKGFGDIFCVRVAGNVLNDDILGSLEYACAVAGAKLIVVKGHTHCGAVSSACKQVEMGHITGLLRKITPAYQEELRFRPADMNDEQFADQVARRNAMHVVCEIVDKSELLRNLVHEGKIAIIGAMHDVSTGEVQFMDDRMIYNGSFCEAQKTDY